MSPRREARNVTRLPRGDLAIIFGSGLSVVPDGAEVEDEISYEELGWPATSVAGHPNRLLVARWAPVGRNRLRTLLACGRPHLYEGWDDADLERPVRELSAAGVSGLFVTNATGALTPDLAPGTAVVVTQVVDLQHAPHDEPPILEVAGGHEAARLAASLEPSLPAATGRYVAVPGPQYETPAEAAWLRSFGEVVGMSTAPEVRAARSVGLPVRALSLVVNVSGASLAHSEVVAAGVRLTDGLARGLGPLVGAFLTGLARQAAGNPTGRGAP